MKEIIIYFKRLFCKHKYIEQIVYLLSGKYKKIFCNKCGKVKEYILIENHKLSELKEHDLNKNWYIE